MTSLVRIADTFTNIRASFKIGPADLHTHASLVKRSNNKWLMLDSVSMQDQVKQDVYGMTDNGKSVEAILNLHPFHTASCEEAHKAFPDAKLYGTLRHKNKWPNLPWESGLMEDPETQALFSDALQFSVPEGVDLIPSNEAVHFSSVLAYHPETKTIHVDDTLMFIPTPAAAAIIGFKEGTVQLHPTLGLALQSRKGASEDLRAWVRKIAADWPAVNLCTAHLGNLLAEKNTGDTIESRIRAALTVAEPALLAHELYWGKKDK